MASRNVSEMTARLNEGMESSDSTVASLLTGTSPSRAKDLANTASIHTNFWTHLKIFLCFQRFISNLTPHKLSGFKTNPRFASLLPLLTKLKVSKKTT